MTHKIIDSNFSVQKYSFGEHRHAHWSAQCLAVFTSMSTSESSICNKKPLTQESQSIYYLALYRKRVPTCVDQAVLQPGSSALESRTVQCSQAPLSSVPASQLVASPSPYTGLLSILTVNSPESKWQCPPALPPAPLSLHAPSVLVRTTFPRMQWDVTSLLPADWVFSSHENVPKLSSSSIP